MIGQNRNFKTLQRKNIHLEVKIHKTVKYWTSLFMGLKSN